MFGRGHQIYHDFATLPKLVERYFAPDVRDGALRAARNVNGVSAALSPLVAGEQRWHESNMYAAAVAGIDVATDAHGMDLHPHAISEALSGNCSQGPLKPVADSVAIARCNRYTDAIRGLAAAQDDSQLQTRPETVKEYIMNVTQRKGGYAFTAHVCTLADSVSDEEWRWAMRVGGVMQLLDDYIDRNEDAREGISTAFTEGWMDYEDLHREVHTACEITRAMFGDAPGVKSLNRTMRLHMKLGRAENAYPGAVSKMLPWYF